MDVLFGGIIVLGCAFAAYAYMSSMFSDVVITRGPFQELKVAYITIKGDYKSAWNNYEKLSELINKRNYTENKASISTLPCVGIYYDDPSNVTDKTQLRSIIGIIIKDEWEEKDMGDNLHYGFIRSVKDSIQVRFPQRTMFSVFTAIKKVYPKIFEYIKEQKLACDNLTAVAEIYMLEKGKMIFLQGIGKYEGLLTKIPKTFDY